MRIRGLVLARLLVSLVVVSGARGITINEAESIRNDDPCAVELQLGAGSRSDNLACRVVIIDTPDTRLQCFSNTEICDGNVYCQNGNDEGRGFTTPSQINCTTGEGKFDCSSTESINFMKICDGTKDCSGGEDERMTLCRNKCRGSYYGGCPITRRCNSSLDTVTCGECFPGYVTNPRSPSGDCLPIITISFECESYTALEGSSQPLEVCIHTTNRIKSEQRLTVNVDITAEAVGATPDDYNIPSTMRLTLTSTQSRRCINISIIDDRLVEGNETFSMSLRVSDTGDSRDQVELGMPNTTTVTIVDNDVVSVGFANSCYVMRTGQANVCLAIVNDVQLLSNFSLRLRLNNDGFCTSLLPFVFQTNATTGSIACSPLFRERTINACFNISFNTSCQTEKINASFEGLSTTRVCRSSTNDGFCPAMNITSNFSTLFIWQRTPAGANATFTCPNNPRFSVSRECFSCSGAGIWMDFNRRGCGRLTGDLNTILRSLSVGCCSGGNFSGTVHEGIMGLAEAVMESADGTNLVDQTRNNLKIMSVILETVAEYVQFEKDSDTDATIVKESTRTVNYLQQWTPTAVHSDESSSVVQSFEVISSVHAQRLSTNVTQNFTFESITLIAQTSDLEDLQVGRSVSIDEGDFTIESKTSISGNPSVASSLPKKLTTIPTISLPGSVFERINDTNRTGLVFTLYKESTLFPTRSNNVDNSSKSTTMVGSRVIAANVAQSDTVFEDLQEPIIVLLPLEIGEKGFLRPGSETCMSWDFNLRGWSRRGCETVVKKNGVVMCACNHLTNYAVLVDICYRQEHCQPIDPVVDTVLSFISYIGITISIIGLTLAIITMLIFKKIRQKETTVYNVQLSIALLLMLVMALVLVAVSSEAANILYGGCVFISVTVHYFTLVAVMWMGAAAVLMFQKVVLVFVRTTTTQFVIVSLICWIVPLVPVLVSLIIDLALGDDPTSNLIIRRTGTESFCFLSHVGIFWGAFLGPILLVMIFNLIIFVCVIFVLIRHVIVTTTQSKQTMGYAKGLRIMFSIGGVMSLFGLTWLFAILTVSVPGLRETFQILFTIFNSFQGFFIFVFFCVLNKEARNSWMEVFSHAKKQGESSLLKVSSPSKHTSSTGVHVDHELLSTTPYASASTDSKLLTLPATFTKPVSSDSDMKSPSDSKSGKILGLDGEPESSTFLLTPSKPTFIT